MTLKCVYLLPSSGFKDVPLTTKVKDRTKNSHGMTIHYISNKIECTRASKHTLEAGRSDIHDGRHVSQVTMVCPAGVMVNILLLSHYIDCKDQR